VEVCKGKKKKKKEKKENWFFLLDYVISRDIIEKIVIDL